MSTSQKISRPTDNKPTDNEPAVIDHTPFEVSVESTIAPIVDSFAAAANSFPQTGGGSYLKHDGRSGEWTCAGLPVLPEDRWAAINVRYGFKYLAAGQPMEDYPQTLGLPFKTRAELGVHLDPDIWPIVDGVRTDPLKEYVSLDVIRLNDGTFNSYDGLNKTGRRAVIELSKRITWQRAERAPTAKPVLQLDSRVWQSGTRTVFIPVFNITTWLVPSDYGRMRLETDSDRPTLRDQLDDQNPW